MADTSEPEILRSTSVPIEDKSEYPLLAAGEGGWGRGERGGGGGALFKRTTSVPVPEFKRTPSLDAHMATGKGQLQRRSTIAPVVPEAIVLSYYPSVVTWRASGGENPKPTNTNSRPNTHASGPFGGDYPSHSYNSTQGAIADWEDVGKAGAGGGRRKDPLDVEWKVGGWWTVWKLGGGVRGGGGGGEVLPRTIAGWKERLVLVGGWGDAVWGCMSDVCECGVGCMRDVCVMRRCCMCNVYICSCAIWWDHVADGSCDIRIVRGETCVCVCVCV
jgi:hypothetical protein